MRQKVFCIGMFKTGTTSLENLMRKYGFRTDGFAPTAKFWNSKHKDVFPENYTKFRIHKDEIRKHVNNFDFFSDYPWMFTYEIVYELFPNSKFILTTRETKEVINSSFNFEEKMNGKNIEKYGEKKLKNMYEDRFVNHYNKVVKFFSNKKDRLLIIDLKDKNKEKKICDFLNIKYKSHGFPHSNRT